MMIRQPDWVGPDLLEQAQDAVRVRGRPGLPRVRAQSLVEGWCVQALHVGAYDDEAPLLRSLHRDVLPEHGLVPAGHHHEIYLNDPRRTAPARLRTVLRQPVRSQRSAS